MLKEDKIVFAFNIGLLILCKSKTCMQPAALSEMFY
jgi:hypothetical protein